MEHEKMQQAMDRLMCKIRAHEQTVACAGVLKSDTYKILFSTIGPLHSALCHALQQGNLRRAYRYYGGLSYVEKQLDLCQKELERYYIEHFLV